MSERPGRFLKVLLIVAGSIAVLLAAVEILLGSRFLTNKVTGILEDSVDADVSCSRIRLSLFRDFPDLSVSADNLSVTYPHERFSAYDLPSPDRFHNEGRGVTADTLAAFDRLYVTANPRRLLDGEIYVGKAFLEGTRLYIHNYADSVSNANIFRTQPADTLEEKEETSLPLMVFKDIRIDADRICYTDLRNGISSDLSLGRLSAGGSMKIDPDSLWIAAALDLDAATAPLHFEADGVRTEAALKLGLSVDGLYAGEQRPDVEVTLAIPGGRVLYKPAGIAGKVKLDARVEDLLGKDPSASLKGLVNARLDSVRTHIASDKIHPYGNLDIKLDAGFKLSDLSAENLHRASLKGSVTGDFVGMNMPSDSIRTAIYRPGIEISSGPDGLDLVVAADSVLFRKGAGLLAKAREMRNAGRLYNETFNGESVPTISFDSSGESLFLRSDANRVGIRGYKLGAKARKNADTTSLSKRPSPDPNRKPPLFLSEKAFEAGDIDIALDTTLTALLSKWNPTASASFGSGFVASPAIPLRTRISGFSFIFDGDRVKLDSVKVTSGVSDVSVRGHLSGLRRALMRKGLLSTDIKIHSDYFNLNEIVSALEMGEDIPRDTTLVENDESFVVDSIADAQFVNIPMPLVIVPANLFAQLDVDVDRFDVMDFVVRPGMLKARMQERTLQISDAQLCSNVGTVGLEAFYSTQSKENIYAGADVELKGMTVPQLMNFIPGLTEKVPALASFEGNLACSASATTQLDTCMNVVIPSLEGVLNVSGTDLNISDAGDLRKYTSLLLFRNKNIGHIDDLHLNAVVHDSKLEIFPVQIGVDRYRLALQGMQNFDKSMYYHVSVLRSPFLIPFGVDLYGYPGHMRFSLARAKFRDGKVPAFTEELGSMKLNIASSISNIFGKSYRDISEYNRREREALEEHKKREGYSAEELAGDLSEKDRATLDSLSLAGDMMQDELELETEVNSVLEESYSETAKLLEKYTSTFYDDKMLRRMEKMRKKEERKQK